MKRRRYRVGLIPGDGVGPEVIREGVKVLEAAAAKERVSLDWVPYDFGADRYLRTKEALPDSALQEFRKLDAIYFGAIGRPDVPPGALERGLLLKLRFELDLYINLRPCVLYPGVETPLRGKEPGDINFLVVRENTEGAYVGIGGIFKKGTPDEVAVQEDVNTRRGVERCVRFAFEQAVKARRRKVTLVDKSNVLIYAHDLWQRVFQEVGREFPKIVREHLFVDAACMEVVRNPARLDVVVTNNLFGDILTDLAAVVQGGMGVAPSGNLHPGRVGMFEPVHGSAPDIAGKGLANPVAAILAGAMMLEQIGAGAAAARVDGAVRSVLASGRVKSMEAGKMGLSTSQLGDLIARAAS